MVIRLSFQESVTVFFSLTMGGSVGEKMLFNHNFVLHLFHFWGSEKVFNKAL